MFTSFNQRTLLFPLFTLSLLSLFIGDVSAGSPSYGNTDSAVLRAAPEEAKPIAGRNRRRNLPMPHTSYPYAVEDRLQVSSQVNKLRINVLANDLGNSLKVSSVNRRSAKGGRVYLKGNQVIYQPSRHYLGEDQFWYTVQDKAGKTHSARVIICLCDY